MHITFVLCSLVGVNATYWSADFEYHALSDPHRYVCMVAALTLAACFAAWRRKQANLDRNELQFEEQPPPAITTLGL